MTDDTTASTQAETPAEAPAPTYLSPREARRAERRARREQHRAARAQRWGWGGSWVWGLVLIVLGGIFLLQNLGITFLGNWWVIFILIPAFYSFANAARAMQADDGRINREARGSLFGGFLLLLVAAALFFEFNWAIIWPLILILFGIGALLNGLFRD